MSASLETNEKSVSTQDKSRTSTRRRRAALISRAQVHCENAIREASLAAKLLDESTKSEPPYLCVHCGDMLVQKPDEECPRCRDANGRFHST